MLRPEPGIRRTAATAILAILALVIAGCSYRTERPPPLGEDLRVVVTVNDTRLVRMQAALHAAVAKAIQDQLGWRVSPTGSARLELTIGHETIRTVARNDRNLPTAWEITMKGTATMISRRGVLTNTWQGLGSVGTLSNEPDAIDAAAANAGLNLSAWLEGVSANWK